MDRFTFEHAVGVLVDHVDEVAVDHAVLPQLGGVVAELGDRVAVLVLQDQLHRARVAAVALVHLVLHLRDGLASIEPDFHHDSFGDVVRHVHLHGLSELRVGLHLLINLLLVGNCKRNFGITARRIPRIIIFIMLTLIAVLPLLRAAIISLGSQDAASTLVLTDR